MAVIPLMRDRRPPVEIVEDPKPDGAVSVSIGDDGLISIEIGTGDEVEEEFKFGGDEFDRNLAEDLDEMDLASLASYLLEGIESDEGGRQQWEETANQAANYLGIKLNDPVSSPQSDGTVSQGVVTALLETAMKLWGTARAEMLPVAGPVKVERISTPKAVGDQVGGGTPPVAAPSGITSDSEPGQAPQTETDAAGDDLADALERDMNWYLTKGDRGYYPDTSKMLFHRAIIGIAFKEVFRCPLERKPISRWVMAQDLIVQGDPSHLEAAGRVTKRAKVSQSTMRRLQVMGHYLDMPLSHPTGITSNTELVIGETQGTTAQPMLPRDFDHTVYESCCELGSGTAHDLIGSLALLDQDETGEEPGYPLPYRVSIDVDSRQILAIRRNWKKGDTDHRIRPRFVKYGFIPGFGFYDLGLIHIVGNPTQAATMIQRSVVDAGLFANFPAWAMSQSAASRLENPIMRPGVGEVVKIPTTGQSKLSDNLMSWPYKEPSASSLAMLQKLEGDVRRLAGVVELPVGEGRLGNTPVGTIMSYIEAISQVPGAVHKDDHIAQQQEFELLRELIAEEPEVLTRGNKAPARKWQIRKELLAPDLIPRADPNTPSQIHRLTKIQGLVMLGGLPQFGLGDKEGPIVNQRAIFRRAAEVLSGGDAEEFMMPPQPPDEAPPPPDPKVQAAQIKAEADQAKTQGHLQEKALDHQGKLTEIQAKAAQAEADRMSEDTRAAMQLAGMRLKAGHDAGMKAADHAHESWQNEADRQHERTQSDQDRQHDWAQGQSNQQHEADQKSQDRTHQAGIEGQKLSAGLMSDKGDE